MNERPRLEAKLNSKTFLEYYYLKKELIDFCRKENLQTTGGKMEITNRIVYYLDTGKRSFDLKKSNRTKINETINLETIIENNFVCSEKHREFYKNQIGKTFSFNVAFQKWLKNNAGKNYKDSIEAYYQILEDKKKNKTTIDKQFEYNAYIRDFFDDNKNKTLKDAISCWKYKKSLKGHNKYEKEDLKVLNN